MYTTPLFGTGFEMGVVPLAASEYNLATISSTYVKTGVYSLRIEDSGHARFAVPDTPTSLYVSVWCRPHSGNDPTRIRVYLDSGHYVDAYRNHSTNTWDVYVNGSSEASGSIVTSDDVWQHVQVHFDIANSGEVTIKVDGVEDASFSGDTMPGATGNIEYVYLYVDNAGVSHRYSYWDDLSFGTGDWGGDIRFDAIVPDADDSVEWTPSTGDNYTTVDEIPASDSDYVSAGSPSLKDKYTLGNWPSTNKTPHMVTEWVRVWKAAADGSAIDIGIDSGGTEESAGSFNITTTAVNYYHVFDDDPSTGSPWAASGINALKAFIESY